MHPDAFSSLPLSSYKLSLRALEASTLPAFLGSTLRGAFGHALKEAVCMMEHRDCERCMLAERCPYPYLFETPAPPDLHLLRGQQQAPRPFVLTLPVLETTDYEHPGAEAPPSGSAFGESSHGGNDLAGARSLSSFVAERPRQLTAGGELNFALLLIGRAVEYLPYVVYAMSRLARHGLGVARARFDLSDVSALDEYGNARVIYTGTSARLAPHAFATRGLSEFVSARLDQLSVGGALKLRFLTPTESTSVKAWADWLKGRVFPNGSPWQTMLGERLCVVHDDVLSFLLNTATEITARVKIKDDAKTVETGGLWYEESLPAESVLFGLALAFPNSRTVVDGQKLTPQKIFEEVGEKLTRTMQFGGKATVGRGICRVSMTNGAAPVNGG